MGFMLTGTLNVNLRDVLNYQLPDQASLEHRARVVSSSQLLELLSVQRMDARLQNIAAASRVHVNGYDIPRNFSSGKRSN